LEAYQRGDRVTLKEPIGVLTTENIGLVVERYEDTDLSGLPSAVGTKDFKQMQGEFDYAVVFPGLRAYISTGSSAWLTDKVDLSQFHAGDVVPCKHSELNLVDSVLRDVA
jgi:hypothetical protein